MKKIVHHAKRAHHRLVSLPTIIIIICLAASAGLSVLTLRANNLNMSELRGAVSDADVIGDKAATEAAMQKLRSYVSRHMNTTTVIDLKSSYQRDSLAAQQAAAAKLGNVGLYSRAESECLSSGLSSSLLADCINDHLSGANGSIIALPDARLYHYSFDSPPLSLDLAGLMITALAIFFYAGVHQLVVYLVKKV